MKWVLSHRADPSVRSIADRHYNRQSIGSPQFVPPGRCVVLRTEVADAFWITSWPFAEYVRHAWAGAWVCSAFRNESADKSSVLITEALAASRTFFAPPRIGSWMKASASHEATRVDRVEIAMVCFVDREKVTRKRDFGRCYLRAGFRVVGETKGGLLALGIRTDDLPPPCSPRGTQTALF